MHLDVIGVTVYPVVVVAGQDIGAFRTQDCRELLGSIVDRSGPERPWRMVGGRIHHPRIDIAQELQPMHAEDFRRCLRLGNPALPEFFAIGQKAVGYLAVLASGRHHQHHTMAILEGLTHDATARDALVVWMSVKRHQRSHATTLLEPADILFRHTSIDRYPPRQATRQSRLDGGRTVRHPGLPAGQLTLTGVLAPRRGKVVVTARLVADAANASEG
jgi:hypothetical protein